MEWDGVGLHQREDHFDLADRQASVISTLLMRNRRVAARMVCGCSGEQRETKRLNEMHEIIPLQLRVNTKRAYTW